jgi:Undecaprenyl-phosphate glucose phosphotransferase
MPVNFQRIGLAGLLLMLVQSVAAPAVCVAVLFAATLFYGIEFSQYYVALSVVSALLCYIFLRPVATQDLREFSSAWTITTHTALAWAATIAALLLIGYATKVSAEYSRLTLFTWFLIAPPLMAGTLITVKRWIRRLIIRSGQTRKAIIAGVNDAGRQLAQNLKQRPELGLDFRGFFDDRGADRLPNVDPSELIGRLTDLPGFVDREHIDTVFIAIPLSDLARTQPLINELSDTTVSVYFVPDILVFNLIQARTDDLAGIPVVAICETPFNGWRGLVKRGSDIVMAALMLLVALPVMLVIAAAVKLSSPGSIIFTQRRYGLDGREILVYKFRTMTVSEDGDRVKQATRTDSRVTPIGAFLRRYSLDELPQLINVLQGRMSVVGPRPHAVAHNEEYRKLIRGYMVRHKVAPGITGLAQINGFRGETANLQDMEKRVHYDIEYLRSWSLGLDIKIILKTLAIWFKDQKAY